MGRVVEVRKWTDVPLQWRVSAGTMEVGKLGGVPDNSPTIYSGFTIHNPDGADDRQVGHDSIPLHSIFLLIKGKLMVECILDSCCQIVVMNSVIWEKLSHTLQVE
jgi:hypothetical protein